MRSGLRVTGGEAASLIDAALWFSDCRSDCTSDHSKSATAPWCHMRVSEARHKTASCPQIRRKGSRSELAPRFRRSHWLAPRVRGRQRGSRRSGFRISESAHLRFGREHSVKVGGCGWKLDRTRLQARLPCQDFQHRQKVDTHPVVQPSPIRLTHRLEPVRQD